MDYLNMALSDFPKNYKSKLKYLIKYKNDNPSIFSNLPKSYDYDDVFIFEGSRDSLEIVGLYFYIVNFFKKDCVRGDILIKTSQGFLNDMLSGNSDSSQIYYNGKLDLLILDIGKELLSQAQEEQLFSNLNCIINSGTKLLILSENKNLKSLGKISCKITLPEPSIVISKDCKKSVAKKGNTGIYGKQ